MKSEDQVVSLELAKKLKDLGFEQESLFYWIEQSDGIIVNRSLAIYKENGCDLRILWGRFTLYGDYEKYSAYTVAELGEMLPASILNKGGHKLRLSVKKENSDFNGWYSIYSGEFEEHFEYADTEANARAKMLIYLKENNLI